MPSTFFAFTNGTFLGLPVPLVYLLVLAMVMGLALHHTAWGRHVFAIGGNAKAAALTGVPVDRVRISVYMLCGLSAGAAGILMQPDGQRAYVSCTPDDYIVVIDLKSLTVTSKINPGKNPDGLAWAVRK